MPSNSAGALRSLPYIRKTSDFIDKTLQLKTKITKFVLSGATLKHSIVQLLPALLVAVILKTEVGKAFSRVCFIRAHRKERITKNCRPTYLLIGFEFILAPLIVPL
jgi:hypothetical protein